MKKIRFDYGAWIPLVIAVLSTILCGNKFGVAIAQFVFMTFSLRFILRFKTSLGWLVLMVPATLVLTIADWGIVPGDSLFLSALPWLLTMLVVTMSMLIYKVIVNGSGRFVSTLILPCVYTLLSYVYATANVFGTWDQMAYKFYGNQDVLQIISLTGIWGIGFLTVWTASVINWMWSHEFSIGGIRKGLAIYLALIFVIILYGQMRLHSADISGKTVKVAGITLKRSIDESLDKDYGGWEGLISSVRDGRIDVASSRTKLDQFSRDMFEKTVIAAKGGAKIIFWAEASGYVLAGDEAAMIEKGKQICTEYNIYLGLSSYALYNEDLNRVDGKFINNHIVFLSPKGEILADCIKKRPVPGPEAESLIRSDEPLPVVNTEYGKVSFAVCFDGDFQRVIRDGKDADLFFLPSKDWEAITPVHSEMASIRAIENGFSLVKVASMGQSSAYDWLGRPLAIASDFSSTDGAVFYADVPTHSVKTVYEFFGDYFPIVSGVLFLALSTHELLRRRKLAGLRVLNQDIECKEKMAE